MEHKLDEADDAYDEMGLAEEEYLDAKRRFEEAYTRFTQATVGAGFTVAGYRASRSERGLKP